MRRSIISVSLITTLAVTSGGAMALDLAGERGLAPDILEIEVDTTAARVSGSSASIYAFFLSVAGDTGLTDVTVTPPGRPTIVLAFDPEDEVFFAELGFYSSLSALRQDYPLGDYLFEFNGATSSITLDYPDLEPDCFTSITEPDAACPVSPTPTIAWTLPGGCAAGAVDVGLEKVIDEEPVFELAFIPASDGSIVLPAGPVTPDPLEPLPPLGPLVAGDLYQIGVDVVDGLLTVESIGSDSFVYFASFRNDLDMTFTVGGGDSILALGLDGDELAWDCAGVDATGFDIVRGDLVALNTNAGDFSGALVTCLNNDLADPFLNGSQSPGMGEGYWYLVREVTLGGNGSYTGAGPLEVPGRDAEIAASGFDCP